MHATYKNALMWTLYGAFFLLLTVLQTVVFGRARFFDVKLSILPVCIACVAMLCGAEAGALYGLCCGTVWCFTGASGGRAAYRADDDLRRGDRLSLRPVSGAAAAVGADHEPAWR